ncbi:MAG: GspE/PulE family protein [Candidatus Omnitrophota bacterium]
MKKEQIEKMLLNHKLVTREQVHLVEEEIKKTGLSFFKAAEKIGIIEEKELNQLISEEMGVPFVDISNYLIDSEIINRVPEKVARKYKLIPLFQTEDSLTLAMADPKNILALDEVRRICSVDNIETVFSTEEMIFKAIDDYYSEGVENRDVLSDIAAKAEAAKGEDVEGTAIIKMVNLIFLEGVKSRASDIHIEPAKDSVRLRYRVDGALYEANNFPKYVQSAIISRIKLLAFMDIAEARLPQDGRIALKIGDKELDVRASTFPTIYGENVVLRLLDKSSMLLGLKELGLSKKDSPRFEKSIRAPFGIIFVTGPTGSGKTTTLYAILASINSMAKNIITIEDPVEYEIPLIRQTQVNLKSGLTFANGLKAILRQDPDIIMVGEVRDLETAEIAMRAAMTGHLVISTLHTNDAPSAISRLLDMGIEPFFISNVVAGVLAQRLVRIICPKCKEKYKPPAEVLDSLKLFGIKEFYHGKGCLSCKDTGFSGRIGIFEFLEINKELKEMILNKASVEEIRKAAVKGGMRSLYEDGLEKVRQGITSLEEILSNTKNLE